MRVYGLLLIYETRDFYGIGSKSSHFMMGNELRLKLSTMGSPTVIISYAMYWTFTTPLKGRDLQ